MKQLHILNGEATLELFQKSTVEGDTVVWQEVLSEGPCVHNVGSEQFWNERKQFFLEYFTVSHDIFENKTIKEFNQLSKLEQYDEVTLWFEYDLYCQLNMMALLAWLKFNAPNNMPIYLVCTGKVAGNDKLHSLGEFSPAVYPDLFKDRQKLWDRDIDFADMVWQKYSSNNHQQLVNLDYSKQTAFPYLEDAMKAHCLRYPNFENGLNEIELFILKTVMKGESTRHRIIGALLKRDNLYGFGDLQYYQILKGLDPLFEEGILQLNDNGHAVLEGTAHFDDFREKHFEWGGCTSKDYYWDEGFQMLLKRLSEKA